MLYLSSFLSDTNLNLMPVIKESYYNLFRNNCYQCRKNVTFPTNLSLISRNRVVNPVRCFIKDSCPSKLCIYFYFSPAKDHYRALLCNFTRLATLRAICREFSEKSAKNG